MIQWITENWMALAAVFSAGIVFAKAIAKVTPNKTDDAVVEKLEALEKQAEDVAKAAFGDKTTAVIAKPK